MTERYSKTSREKPDQQVYVHVYLLSLECYEESFLLLLFVCLIQLPYELNVIEIVISSPYELNVIEIVISSPYELKCNRNSN